MKRSIIPSGYHSAMHNPDRDAFKRIHVKDGDDPREWKPGGYLLKESVDEMRMDIYEKELSGEITVEERDTLLDYLDMKTSY